MNEQDNSFSSDDLRGDEIASVDNQNSAKLFDVYIEERFDDRQEPNEHNVSVERLNQLLYQHSISPSEHSFLLQKLSPAEKHISKFSWSCLACAVISWVSFMTFTYEETKYQLMSGENRLYVVTFFVPLICLFFYLAQREIRKKSNVKGFEIALIGLTIAVGQATVMIPTWLMHFYQTYS